MSDDNAIVSIRTLRPGLPEDKIVKVETPPHKALPEKYSQAVHNEITRLVGRGNTQITAAAAAGVPKLTWAAWQRDVTDGIAHPAIVSLMEDVERAYHLFTTNATNTIVDVDDEGHIRSAENAKWMLERTRANDFAPKLGIMMKSEIEVLFEKLEHEFRDQPEILDRIYKALA